MFHTMMVPLDGSAMGEQAAILGGRLAAASHAALHLVHVHEPYTLNPISVDGMPVIDDELRSLAGEHELAYLRQVAKGLGQPGLAPTIARLEGPVAAALSQHSRQIGADLLVLTTHGHSGFAHFWLGSVAEALVRSLAVPLLLLHPDGPPPAALRRVLVPLDGSALSEQVLPHAIALAGIEGGELTLLRVVEGRASPLSADAEADAYNLREARATAEIYLGRLADKLGAAGLPAHTRIIESAQPARAILAAAEEERADLIALATRGRSGLAQLLLGSVADKVIRGSRLPVLALRPTAPDGGPDTAP